MPFSLAVILAAALAVGLRANDEMSIVRADDRPTAVLLVQQGQQQMPFFRDRQPPPAAPARPMLPTPQLQLKADPSQAAGFSVTSPSGQKYRVQPDAFSGWYRLEDQSGRTVYKIRPNVRGQGTYDVKP